MAEQSEECDLINRDPNNLNDGLRIMFEDVICEPEGTHSMDCNWRNSFSIFNCSKSCCYKFLTFFCGILTALCWGCKFACISFTMIWYILPCLKVWEICLGCSKKFVHSYYNCCIAPCCEAYGMFFSKIRVVTVTEP